jgi:hypothetical protein
MDSINLNTILKDFVSKNTQRFFFVNHWSIIVLFKIIIIVILLFFQVYCFSIIIFLYELNIHYKLYYYII